MFEAKIRIQDEQLIRAESETYWSQNASELRGQVGRRFLLRCPQFGTEGYVWGSDVYTDDSSICTAAVHAGLIDFNTGGEVQIEIRPGQRHYGRTERNGVVSHDYGEYPGSFTFVRDGGTWDDRSTSNPDLDDLFGRYLQSAIELTSWETTAKEMRGWIGYRATVTCPAGGEPGVIWGSGPYTDDSSICTAAVHSGLISFENGGDVTFEITPGLDKYTGEPQNGVNAWDFDSWPGSFRFVRYETEGN